MMPEQRQSCVLFGAGQVGGRAVAALLATGFARPIRLFGAETWPPSEPPPLLKRFLFDGMEPKALLLPGFRLWRSRTLWRCWAGRRPRSIATGASCA